MKSSPPKIPVSNSETSRALAVYSSRWASSSSLFVSLLIAAVSVFHVWMFFFGPPGSRSSPRDLVLLVLAPFFFATCLIQGYQSVLRILRPELLLFADDTGVSYLPVADAAQEKGMLHLPWTEIRQLEIWWESGEARGLIFRRGKRQSVFFPMDRMETQLSPGRLVDSLRELQKGVLAAAKQRPLLTERDVPKADLAEAAVESEGDVSILH